MGKSIGQRKRRFCFDFIRCSGTNEFAVLSDQLGIEPSKTLNCRNHECLKWAQSVRQSHPFGKPRLVNSHAA
jgi:hypothetical protein